MAIVRSFIATSNHVRLLPSGVVFALRTCKRPRSVRFVFHINQGYSAVSHLIPTLHHNRRLLYNTQLFCFSTVAPTFESSVTPPPTEKTAKTIHKKHWSLSASLVNNYWCLASFRHQWKPRSRANRLDWASRWFQQYLSFGYNLRMIKHHPEYLAIVKFIMEVILDRYSRKNYPPLDHARMAHILCSVIGIIPAEESRVKAAIAFHLQQLAKAMCTNNQFTLPPEMDGERVNAVFLAKLTKILGRTTTAWDQHRALCLRSLSCPCFGDISRLFSVCISVFTQHRDTDGINQAWKSMAERGVRPRSHDLLRSITFYANIGDTKLCQELFEAYNDRLGRYREAIYVQMLRVFGRSHVHVDYCVKLFESMLDQGIAPSLTTFTVLANVFAEHGKISRVMTIVRHVQHLPYKEDPYIAAVILKAYYNSGNIGKVIPMFYRLQQQGYTMNEVAYHVLLRAYAWLRQMDRVTSTIHDMAQAGLEPSAYTYTFLIQCAMSASQWQQCQEIYTYMIDKGVRPTIVTLTVLLPLLFRNPQMEQRWVESLLLPSVEDLTNYDSLCHALQRLGVEPDLKWVASVFEQFWHHDQLESLFELWKSSDQGFLQHHWGYLTGIVVHALLSHQLYDLAQQLLDYAFVHHPQRCQVLGLYTARFQFNWIRHQCRDFLDIYRQLIDHRVSLRANIVAKTLAYAYQVGRRDLADRIYGLVKAYAPHAIPSSDQVQQILQELDA
ncbi:hypothetical protein IWQ61_002626 [Dispira simplex]|nr:hypothetical protein IWQ61_002626 [Dispira simplex]